MCKGPQMFPLQHNYYNTAKATICMRHVKIVLSSRTHPLDWFYKISQYYNYLSDVLYRETATFVGHNSKMTNLAWLTSDRIWIEDSVFKSETLFFIILIEKSISKLQNTGWA